MIKIKRVYENPDDRDGVRFLVERLWPRGMTKEKLKIKARLKDAAPSPGLRKWYAHDLSRWLEFQQRYRAELEANPDAWKLILETAKGSDVTLVHILQLFSAPE